MLVARSAALRPSSLSDGSAKSWRCGGKECKASVALEARRTRGGRRCQVWSSAKSARFGFGPRALPNWSLNTGPSAAGRLAREALTVYAAPRGQAAPPLQAG